MTKWLSIRIIFRGISILFFAFFLVACETQRRQLSAFYEEQATPSYIPTNFSPEAVPAGTLRVAILPLQEPNLGDQQLNELDRILQTELAKTTCFEIVPITRDRISAEFGFPFFTRQTCIPFQLCEAIQEGTQADAILLSELISYHPFTPIVVGLRLTLIDIKTKTVLWAFDDTFDSGLSTVALGAQRYASVAFRASYPFDERHTILLSPRWFFQYASYEAFKTIKKSSLVFIQS